MESELWIKRWCHNVIARSFLDKNDAEIFLFTGRLLRVARNHMTTTMHIIYETVSKAGMTKESQGHDDNSVEF